MSNPIRYDSLLVHYLAATLHERLNGRACNAVPLRQDHRTALLALDRDEALLLDLNPDRGWIRLVPQGRVALADPDASIAAVSAPWDERRIVVDLQGSNRFRPLQRRLIVELHTNHWNLLLVDAEERIVFVLHPRDAGGRTLRPGASYTPPQPRPRLSPRELAEDEAWSEWERLLSTTPLEDHAREVQRRFALLGPLNTGWILGDGPATANGSGRRAAFERWWQLARLPRAEPAVLRLPRGAQPYPFPLPGLPAEPVGDLLEAMERVAREDVPPAPAEAPAEVRTDAIERRLRSARQRVQRLREQLDEVEDSERARSFGDLLLAHLAAVPRGADRVRLPGWDGGEVEIPLEPALSPAENATRWYDTAKRQARAAARLPELLQQAEADVERWEGVLGAARTGALEAGELAAFETSAASEPGGADPEGPRLPYRVYRTSGGLEVRVGRGSADNDRLTFGNSRPEDVWLHARSVPGSHVILRWGSAEHAPPARDLTEAAGLAAWFSKARTSGLVAVDWTRRKYIRKPRGAPPGAVIPQRVKTVFVEPDPELERRMAGEEGEESRHSPSGER